MAIESELKRAQELADAHRPHAAISVAQEALDSWHEPEDRASEERSAAFQLARLVVNLHRETSADARSLERATSRAIELGDCDSPELVRGLRRGRAAALVELGANVEAARELTAVAEELLSNEAGSSQAAAAVIEAANALVDAKNFGGALRLVGRVAQTGSGVHPFTTIGLAVCEGRARLALGEPALAAEAFGRALDSVERFGSRLLRAAEIRAYLDACQLIAAAASSCSKQSPKPE